MLSYTFWTIFLLLLAFSPGLPFLLLFLPFLPPPPLFLLRLQFVNLRGKIPENPLVNMLGEGGGGQKCTRGNWAAAKTVSSVSGSKTAEETVRGNFCFRTEIKTPAAS